MCGINGILNVKHPFDHVSLLRKMHEATKHRGTRDVEQVHNDHRKAIVSFNWLQITDQSKIDLPNGFWKDGSHIAYLNGFISNYRELANKYGIELETDCDIEFLTKFLNLHNGNKLNELNGFFAVLYWSPFYKGWFMFTDRYGIKQLYKYTNSDGVTFISSEVKGILAACPEIEIDESAVEDWKCTLGVMNPNTIYKGIERVAKLPFFVTEKKTVSELPYEAAKKLLIYHLQHAFLRNTHDGKTGVYLSGGIDSGLIASEMRPDYCFSVDYVDEKFSESDLIKKNSVNAHLSLMVNEQMARKYCKETMKALDDLKAGSCYTNFAIAELASNFVQVVYSGAGGDEFFGGYPHRKSRDPRSSIVRTDYGQGGILLRGLTFDENRISHFEYDLKFLDAVLVVEDRMSGFHTMETRYPLLDNDLVDFALSLPDEYLENKRILKDVSGLHPDVINGKKKGFSNPYFTNDEWVEFTLKNLEK